MIELRVLGPISLKRSDGSNVAPVLAQPKRLALATYLAAPPPHGGRCFHRKDTLVAMFWPELDQRHARAALRNALYFLRTHLGASAVVGGADDAVGLNPAEFWCDVDAFDVAVRVRDHAMAHQLYRGELLAGVFVPDAEPFVEWLDAQRRRRAAEALEAAAQAARRHAAAGRLAEALVWAKRVREMDPLNEDGARMMISLRHVTGDPAGALDEYARLEQLLESEHGLAPSLETKRLVQALRDDDSEAATIAIAQVPVRAGSSPGRGAVTPRSGARVHDRAVLEAFAQTRVGLARRRGDRVGVILVRLEDRTAAALAQLRDAVLQGVRTADLVAELDTTMLAVLPAEDGAIDVNALVGRLSRHLADRSDARGGLAVAARNRIETIWLDPADGLTATALLATALEKR